MIFWLFGMSDSEKKMKGKTDDNVCKKTKIAKKKL